MSTEPHAASTAPSIRSENSENTNPEPTPVPPQVSDHVRIRERSYKLLEDARIRARDMKK